MLEVTTVVVGEEADRSEQLFSRPPVLRTDKLGRIHGELLPPLASLREVVVIPLLTFSLGFEGHEVPSNV
jgi:hypothetical protein